MNYTLVIQARAKRDIHRIVTWIRKRSPAGSQRWVNALVKATNSIVDNPTGLPLASELPLQELRVREKLFKTRQGLTYRILFLIDGDSAYIVRVRGPRQRPVRFGGKHGKN
jgi:plasmid stabilization system protein ParE